MLKSSPTKIKKEKVLVVTKIDCKNRVNRLKISQSIKKKENPEILSRIQVTCYTFTLFLNP